MGHRSGFATPLYLRASPLSSSGSSSCLDSWRMAFSRSTVVTLSSPFGPSSDKAGSKRIMHFVGLLWPLLTSRSAGRPNSAMPASPFQASGETSPGKNDDLPRTIAGSTPLPLVAGASRSVVARPGPQRLVSGSCSSTHGFVSRFVQRTPHDERLALPFGPCDQVPGGLSPPSHRPCRAHHNKKRREIRVPRRSSNARIDRFSAFRLRLRRRLRPRYSRLHPS